MRKRRNTAHKGRRNEYKTIRMLEDQGHYCIRSAASKGMFDIVALRPQGYRTILVQVKTNGWPPPDERMRLAVADLHLQAVATVLIVRWDDGRKRPRALRPRRIDEEGRGWDELELCESTLGDAWVKTSRTFDVPNDGRAADARTA